MKSGHLAIAPPRSRPRPAPPKPPRHLSKPTRKWFLAIVDDYELEPHHVKLLLAACEAWDRYTAARAVLDAEGPVYHNRFGEPRARPEVAVEHAARISFARLVRELDLDAEPAPEPSRRPPGLRSNRR